MATQKTFRYIYFNARARGELPRLVAAATGIKLTEEVICDEEVEWPRDVKPKTPLGQLPCLVVGDKWYAQKLAISFYLAGIAEQDLLGKTHMESLEIHQSLFFTEDLLELIVKAFGDRDIRNKGPDGLKNVQSNILPDKLPKLEKLLHDNGTGYIVSNRMTIADLAAFDAVEHVVDLEGMEYLNQYPWIKDNFERTASLPSIKDYRTNVRNKTPSFSW